MPVDVPDETAISTNDGVVFGLIARVNASDVCGGRVFGRTGAADAGRIGHRYVNTYATTV